MLCDVVRRRRRRRRRWAHAPVIHAASHFDQKKRVAWVPISMHTCGSFFYNYGAPLGGPSGRRSSAIIIQKITPQAKSGKCFQIWFFPRFGGGKWRRSEHAHASYPGLFFRPPRFSLYMGREKGEFRDWTKWNVST